MKRDKKEKKYQKRTKKVANGKEDETFINEEASSFKKEVKRKDPCKNKRRK